MGLPIFSPIKKGLIKYSLMFDNVRRFCEFSEHNIERELCQPHGPKISENPDIWQCSSKYGIIPW